MKFLDKPVVNLLIVLSLVGRANKLNISLFTQIWCHGNIHVILAVQWVNLNRSISISDVSKVAGSHPSAEL